MKTQHTPGPWKVSNDGNDIEQNYADNAGICTLFAVSEEQDKANARLIAAAPDTTMLLLECYAYILKNMPISQRNTLDGQFFLSKLRGQLANAYNIEGQEVEDKVIKLIDVTRYDFYR